MKNILVGAFIALFAIYSGYYFGQVKERELNDQEIMLKFAPVSDCFVEFRVNGAYMQWRISDFLLGQDWEKNKHRNCEAEVADVLKPFLESHGLTIIEYQYERKQ